MVGALFGQGCWRPMERFLLRQGGGKLRLVDNCLKTEHNAHVQLQEAIHNVSADFVASSVRDALQAVQEQGPVSLDDTPWLQARLATDVLPDAYGGHSVQTARMPLSVLKGWRFTLLYGPAYGLEAAVVACCLL